MCVNIAGSAHHEPQNLTLPNQKASACITILMSTHAKGSHLINYFHGQMDEHYDDFFSSAQKVSDEDQLLTLPRYLTNIMYNFGGLITTKPQFPTSTYLLRQVSSKQYYNYARRLLENNYGLRELQYMSR